MKKKLLIWIVLLGGCCASCNHRLLPGTYSRYESYYGGESWRSESITLHADSTFVYDGNSGDVYYTFGATGTWSRAKNRLLLDSAPEQDEPVREARYTDSNRIVLELLWSDGTVADGVSVSMTEKFGNAPPVWKTSDGEGRVVFPKRDFVDLEFQNLGRRSLKLSEVNGLGYFRIVLPKWDRYEPESSEWKIRGKKLVGGRLRLRREE